MTTQSVKRMMRVGGAVSLLLYPLMLMVAFALHYANVADFFVFKLDYVSSSASDFMDTLASPNVWRLYTLPHLIGYLSLPVMVAASACLSHILFEEKPGLAMLGGAMTATGAIYMGGVFGSWLSFGAIGNLPAGQIASAVPVLAALTEMQGVLLLTTTLSALGLLGMMVLAAGLFQTRLVPRWSSALLFLGNLLVVVFMDLDNWMFIGASLMLAGMLPVSVKLLNLRQPVFALQHSRVH